jgi:hypothetical protein
VGFQPELDQLALVGLVLDDQDLGHEIIAPS